MALEHLTLSTNRKFFLKEVVKDEMHRAGHSVGFPKSGVITWQEIVPRLCAENNNGRRVLWKGKDGWSRVTLRRPRP